MTPRYAIYFAPAHNTPWWAFGAHWLGRDEQHDTALVQPPLAQIAADDLRGITAQPRRYGFHATLKAPFSLRGEYSADDLADRLHRLATTLKPVPLGSLQVRTLGAFVALVPAQVTDDLMTLAAACVTGLDDLRAPLTDADLARRRIEHLSAREQALLQLYGYPYVLERFRFHLTLSGPVTPLVAHQVQQAVTAPVAQLNDAMPLVLDRLCLFVETTPGQAFTRIADAVLRA